MLVLHADAQAVKYALSVVADPSVIRWRLSFHFRNAAMFLAMYASKSRSTSSRQS
jgi:hypothetical protein